MNFVTCRGKSRFIKEWPSHKHPDWELIFQFNGKSHSTVDNCTYEFEEGDFLLIPPGLYHKCKHEHPFSDMFIRFSECRLPLKPIHLRDVEGNITSLFKTIIKLYTEKEFYYKELVDATLDLLLTYIEKYDKVQVTYPFVYAFKDVLYENIENIGFSVNAALDKSGYNRDYFRRCFKKEFGVSPIEYLTDLRITKAKQLLVQEDFAGVGSVAFQCGFADSLYFSTCFKKHRGMPPLQYRKMKLSEKNQ